MNISRECLPNKFWHDILLAGKIKKGRLKTIRIDGIRTILGEWNLKKIVGERETERDRENNWKNLNGCRKMLKHCNFSLKRQNQKYSN